MKWRKESCSHVTSKRWNEKSANKMSSTVPKTQISTQHIFTVLRNKNERLLRSLAKVPIAFGMSFILPGVNPVDMPAHGFPQESSGFPLRSLIYGDWEKSANIPLSSEGLFHSEAHKLSFPILWILLSPNKAAICRCWFLLATGCSRLPCPGFSEACPS